MNRKQRRAQIKTVPTIRHIFDIGLQHHKNGQLPEAEALYRRILAADPRHAETLHLLGVLHHQTGRIGAALALIAQAIAINGNAATYYFNHGNAQKDLGRLDGAIASYDAALRLRPDYAEALSNRGVVLHDLGRLDDALASYDAALRLQPGQAAIHSNRGNSLRELGRFDQAIAAYDTALRLRPDYAEALYNRGNALNGLGRCADALVSYDAALRLRPNFAEALSNRGNALKNLGRLDQAVASYDAALRLRPGLAETHSNRGNALKDLGRLADAILAYDAALAIKPDFAEALYNRGNALNGLSRLDEAIAAYDAALRLRPDCAEALSNRGVALYDLGRPGEARACYDEALRLKPDYAEAHRNLALVKTYAAGDPQLAMMESLHRQAIPDSDRSEICFALGKAYEDLGRAGEAFARYGEGNALRKRALHYAIDQDRALFGALYDLFASPAPSCSAMTAPCVPRPIFIVGMPRSGTTLAEQILASHSQVHGAGELEAMNQAIHAVCNGQGDRFTLTDDALAGIRRRYLAALAGLSSSRPVVTDKMPLNFRWLGYILAAIPEARVVHLVRDPVAVCWSIFKHYFPATGLGFAYDLGDLAAYHLMYQKLMALWRARHPGRIFDLDYRLLTEDQEGQTRSLLDYCGLAWEDACLDFHRTERPVRTASTAQVRRALYRGSSEAWKQFEIQLKPLAEALTPGHA